jgi:hypothetical protein
MCLGSSLRRLRGWKSLQIQGDIASSLCNDQQMALREVGQLTVIDLRAVCSTNACRGTLPVNSTTWRSQYNQKSGTMPDLHWPYNWLWAEATEARAATARTLEFHIFCLIFKSKGPTKNLWMICDRKEFHSLCTHFSNTTEPAKIEWYSRICTCCSSKGTRTIPSNFCQRNSKPEVPSEAHDSIAESR